MTEPETLPLGVHSEAALLPWYANNTLSDEERQHVARHLETCSSCLNELHELTQIQARLAAVYATEQHPSPQLSHSVLNRIAQDASTLRRKKSGAHWLVHMDTWFQSLLSQQWVPSFVGLILLVQFGLLLWATIPPLQREEITSRSLGSPSATFSVTFQQQVYEEQIRLMLTEIQGHIIDGPTPTGTYLIEVLAGDQETSRKKLEILKGRTDVVKSADLERP